MEAYIIIETEIGKAKVVADEIAELPGVLQADDVTGPFDVIAKAEADNVDLLGQIVLARIQNVDGITRTITCPKVHI